MSVYATPTQFTATPQLVLVIRRYLACCLMLMFYIGLAPTTMAASLADWQQDIDEIALKIVAIHPEPFARIGRLEFVREVENLKAELPRLSEEQRVTRTMRLVALVGDSHTQLEPDRADFARWYPLRVYEFTDGFFVTAAHKSVADLAGAQLLNIGGSRVEQVAERARTLMGADNELSAKENLFALSNAALMQGLGYAAGDGNLSVKFKLTSGAIVERVIKSSQASDPRYKKDDATFEWRFQAEMGGPPLSGVDSWLSAYKNLPYAAFRTFDATRPLRLMNRWQFTSKSLPLQSAYYIQANFVGENFAQEFRTALKEVDGLRPRRLIVDLRYCFGGDGSRVPAMLREFIKREESHAWKELYLLTGRRTLSAGIMAAQALMDNTTITVLGEPMAAPVNSYGDAQSIPLSRTGLHLYLSTVKHQLGKSTDINPFSRIDIPAQMSFEEYASGGDPLVDAILRGDEMRSLPVIALTDGGAMARRAWEERRTAFAKFHWWSPPQELDLRRTCDQLRDNNQLADAIELCKLNAEINPSIWNVWYNLANAQLAAGHLAEALTSYRRVLEIDPNNSNADEIRRVFEKAGTRF
ncbi:MAG: tetratricopeptide repeat protein [Rhodocyclaceae bacterium]|nr:tetratricopeptide repeat protein [Rhodocyclaceae bacterium]